MPSPISARISRPVISHDMDFIAAVADRIFVLEDGRIVQMGDHRALMAEGGLYRRLYEAQNANF